MSATKLKFGAGPTDTNSNDERPIGGGNKNAYMNPYDDLPVGKSN